MEYKIYTGKRKIKATKVCLNSLSEKTFHSIVIYLNYNTDYCYCSRVIIIYISTGEYALAFMSNYVQSVGDASPTQNRIIMPMGVTIQEIFRQYNKNRIESDRIREAHFYKLWQKNFQHVSFQKVSLNLYDQS